MPIMIRLETEVEYDENGNKINVATSNAKKELRKVIRKGEPFQISVENRIYNVDSDALNTTAFTCYAENDSGVKYRLRCAFEGSYCVEHVCCSLKYMSL